MKAKKSFGQHFLHREDIAERISNSIITDSDCPAILEVGPGKGMLSKYLLKKKADLYAVEADRDMFEYLKIHLPELAEKTTLMDFLKFDLSALPTPLYVIGNFPYNISSQILFRAIDSKDQVVQLVGMFQKEVARRVASGPGSKEYGVISILVQLWFDVELLFNVGKGAFNPPPKVESAVIRLTRNQRNDETVNWKLFRHLVKSSFGQRRKMLRNTLKPIIKDPEILIDPFFQQRPERLSVEDFMALTVKVEEILKGQSEV